MPCKSMTSIVTEYVCENFQAHSMPLSLIGKLSTVIAHEGEIRESALSASVLDIVAGRKLGRKLECTVSPCNYLSHSLERSSLQSFDIISLHFPWDL